MTKIRMLAMLMICLILAWCGGVEAKYNADGVQIAASYNGEEVLMTAVESWRSAGLALGAEERSDREIAEEIIEGMVLREEAERRGLTATDQEISDMLESAMYAYSFAGTKEILDAYFAEMGIDFEAYLDMLREVVPAVILKQKLLNAVAEEYCAEHGLEYSHDNLPDEVIKAQEEFIEELLKANRDKIKYYVE